MTRCRSKQAKIAFVSKLLENVINSFYDEMDKFLFNPHAKPIDREYATHPSHTMVGVGEPGTMGWEGYACSKCWAREGTKEANVKCSQEC